MSQTLNYMVKVIQHTEQLKCSVVVCGETVAVVTISAIPTSYTECPIHFLRFHYTEKLAC